MWGCLAHPLLPCPVCMHAMASIRCHGWLLLLLLLLEQVVCRCGWVQGLQQQQLLLLEWVVCGRGWVHGLQLLLWEALLLLLLLLHVKRLLLQSLWLLHA